MKIALQNRVNFNPIFFKQSNTPMLKGSFATNFTGGRVRSDRDGDGTRISPNSDSFERSEIPSEQNFALAATKFRTFCTKLLSARGKMSYGDERDFTEIEKMLTIDSLAETKNRGTLFDIDLPRVIANSQKYETPFCLAMFDMDNFKAVNDLFDHAVGNTFIKIIGKTIKDIAKNNGAEAYRLGGEEFVIIFEKGADQKAIKKHAIDTSQEILDSLNTNPELYSYTDQFVKNGKKQIRTLQNNQRTLENLNKLKVRYSDICEYLEEAKGILSPGCDKKTKGSEKQLRSIFINLIAMKKKEILDALISSTIELLEKQLKMAPPGPGKENLFLTFHLYKLEQIKKELKEEGKELPLKKIISQDVSDYLDSKYNQAAKIAQIKKWVSSVAELRDGKMKGFTITAGVKEFNGADKKPDGSQKTLNNYIEEVDAELIRGKQTQKGKVYYSN